MHTDAHWIQTQKWWDVNLWKRVILEVQGLWKRDLPEQEAVLWAIHPSTAPTREFPDEIHVSASAKDEGKLKNNFYNLLFQHKYLSTSETHLVLEWTQSISTASYRKIK